MVANGGGGGSHAECTWFGLIFLQSCSAAVAGEVKRSLGYEPYCGYDPRTGTNGLDTVSFDFYIPVV